MEADGLRRRTSPTRGPRVCLIDGCEDYYVPSSSTTYCGCRCDSVRIAREKKSPRVRDDSSGHLHHTYVITHTHTHTHTPVFSVICLALVSRFPGVAPSAAGSSAFPVPRKFGFAIWNGGVTSSLRRGRLPFVTRSRRRAFRSRAHSEDAIFWSAAMISACAGRPFLPNRPCWRPLQMVVPFCDTVTVMG